MLDRLDAPQLSSVVEAHFAPRREAGDDGDGVAGATTTPRLGALHAAGRLRFAAREPAVNHYAPGGAFHPHTDGQALTVLIALSSPEDDYAGGGTGFWEPDARGARVQPPSVVLRPPAGTALVFGGRVTHAGVPVDAGARVVFVASFRAASESEC